MAAMKQLPQAEWTRETPEITRAQVELDEAVTRYIHGDALREELKQAYQSYAKLHI